MFTSRLARKPDFGVWDAYFEANTARHRQLDAQIPWRSVCVLPPADVVAIARSLQRFELGESGEGQGLLGKARRRNDPAYDAALVRFIGEEQKHSALFAAALDRFGESRLTSHWSDVAFVVLRRMLGLRTEVTLFLIAETTAMEYFGALGRSSDPVIRGVARRVLTDEVEHVKFQIDQLRAGFARTPRAARMLAAGAAWVVAVGAATVLALDHGAAMSALGLRPTVFWRRALGQFGRAVPAAFHLGGAPVPFGPTVESREYFAAPPPAPAAAPSAPADPHAAQSA